MSALKGGLATFAELTAEGQPYNLRLDSEKIYGPFCSYSEAKTMTTNEGRGELMREVQVSVGYALAQLQHSMEHGHEVHERQWAETIAGMRSGAIHVGSRQPMKNVPVWVTPDVVKGGFATGTFAASGPTLPHEIELYLLINGSKETKVEEGEERRLPEGVSTGEMREQINVHFSSLKGSIMLMDLMASDLYTCKVPEEGALCVAAALRASGREREAERLLETISPFFRQLRFYPQLKAAKKEVLTGTIGSTAVSVNTVPDVDRWLQYFCKTTRQITEMKHTIEALLPMYDEAVSLYAETLPEGKELPKVGEDGKVTGAWPCSRIAEGWQGRADVLAVKLQNAIGRRKLSHQRSIKRLAEYLKVPVAQLTGRQVGYIRRILADTNAIRGMPGTPKHVEYRERQQAAARKVGGVEEMAAAVRQRMKQEAEDDIHTDPEILLGAVTEEEAAKWPQVAAGRPLCPGILRKVRTLRAAPLKELIESKAIKSAASLAQLVPRLSAIVETMDFVDPIHKQLYRQLYLAFAYGRRSLLLVNLEHQVRLEELPWVKAMGYLRLPESEKWKSEAALGLLKELVATSFFYFPGTILPNPLVDQLRNVAKAAGIHDVARGLVEELAADIFCGFSVKFQKSYIVACEALSGTLYEAYYDLEEPWAALWQETKKFGAVATERAKKNQVVPKTNFSTAFNGSVIEQAQVMSTHNIALLFSCLPMEELLGGKLLSMAKRAFDTAVKLFESRHVLLERAKNVKERPEPTTRRYGRKPKDQAAQYRHAALLRRKNAAYAWRQMLAFGSYMDVEDMDELIRYAISQAAQMEDKAAQEEVAAVLLYLVGVYADVPQEKIGQWARGEEREGQLAEWLEPLVDVAARLKWLPGGAFYGWVV